MLFIHIEMLNKIPHSTAFRWNDKRSVDSVTMSILARAKRTDEANKFSMTNTPLIDCITTVILSRQIFSSYTSLTLLKLHTPSPYNHHFYCFIGFVEPFGFQEGSPYTMPSTFAFTNNSLSEHFLPARINFKLAFRFSIALNDSPI